MCRPSFVHDIARIFELTSSSKGCRADAQKEGDVTVFFLKKKALRLLGMRKCCSFWGEFQSERLFFYLFCRFFVFLLVSFSRNSFGFLVCFEVS